MKKNEKARTSQMWLAGLLGILMTWALPQRAAGGNIGEYANPSEVFTWYQKGPGCMHLSLKLFDEKQCNIKNACFGVTIDGVDVDCIFMCEREGKDSQVIGCNLGNLLPDETLLYITNHDIYKPLCLVEKQTENPNINNYDDFKYYQVERTAPGSYSAGYVEFDWYYPVRFQGKNLKFYVHNAQISDYANGSTLTNYSRDIGTMEFESITPENYDPTIGMESGMEGTILLPLSSTRPINYLEATYKDAAGNTVTLPRQTMENETYFAFVNLPATEPATDLTITANLNAASIDKSQIPVGTWPSRMDGDVTLKVDNLPMMHNPHLFKATMDSVGGVLLQWKCSDLDREDVLDGDAYMIQRSVTGKEEDFKDIDASQSFDKSVSDYSFRDSTLISSLTAEEIDSALGIPLVRYRIFRASTGELWGMDKNPTLAYAQPLLSTLSLLQPHKAEASWSNKDERKVKVKWTWKPNDSSHNYVWDSRAKLKLETKLYNNDGKLLDTSVKEITDEERRARQMEVTLTRSCVKYEMNLIVDAGTSPIGKGTGKIFYQIKSKDDFKTFAAASQKGDWSTIPQNAIMTDEVNFSENDAYKYYVGSNAHPYEGIFDGNGRGLTFGVAEEASTEEYYAPFRVVRNGAVIRNVHVWCTLKPQTLFSGGIIGHVISGKAFVENCISGSTIESSVDGDGSHGGVVGLSYGNLYISNVLFEGSISGGNTTNCGGFVGWGANFVKITNSYFAPNKLAIKNTAGSSTFVRNRNYPGTFVIEDCSYKSSLGSLQGKQSNSCPSNWCWDSTKPHREYRYFTTPVTASTTAVTLPDDKLYYQNLGEVDKTSLRVESQQSYVLLSWGLATDTPVDYFEVWRQQKGQSNWECLVTQLIDMQYEDKKTSPVQDYIYYVRGVTDCEGKKYQDTEHVAGACVKTGRVSGYVRFPDGTGIPNIQVYIRGGKDTVSVKTDLNGYFMKEGLRYWNDKGESSYDIIPDVPGMDFGARSITFGTAPGDNDVRDVVLLVDKSVKFGGYVRYFGTSIPVQGVSFLVDGIEVHNASGKVKTDHQGHFDFHLLPNRPHSIQAVKDGHVFYQNGYYHADNDTTKTKYDIIADEPAAYFYDNTRIALIGRVAGGTDQGSLPLGNSLSRNNLGDDLKMVFVLEGDKTSKLVFDLTDRNKKERDEVFKHKAQDDLHDYQTRVHTTEYRMEITPDVHTGEYKVMLPPVKWKIQQITARGYATLFQDGQTGDVIDLTDSITLHTDHFTGSWTAADGKVVESVDVEYHAQYNRIYRSPVLLERKQVGFDNFDYFGEKTYTMHPMVGENKKLTIAYPVTTKAAEGVLIIDEENKLITSAGQLSSPNTESKEGSLANLLDGDNTTFWHSTWSKDSVPAGTHYLQVEMPDEELANISARFTRRPTPDDHVTEFGVYGTNKADAEKGSCEQLAVLSTPYKSNTETITTDPFNPKGYKYIRFYANNTTGKDGATRGYWHMSEFQLYHAEKIMTNKEVTTTTYAFGYPVFSTDRGYAINLSALERYYYNNNVHSDTVDVVHLKGASVTVRNGFQSGTHRETISLGDTGEGTFTLRAAQLPYISTGTGALYTATFTLNYDGATFEGEPIKGYTFSQYAKPGAKDIISVDRPILVDILRDPPGGGSSAKLSKGSTLKLAYQMDMSWKAGLSIGWSKGTDLNNYTGIIVGSMFGQLEGGLINNAKNVFDSSYDIVFSGSGQRAFSYTLTANEDISTDAGTTMVDADADLMVGAEADLYIGMETNTFLRPAIAIRAINDSTYQASAGARAAGTMLEIAHGTDADGNPIYLVRDENIGYGQNIKSTFVHSQQYIIKQLIPDLANKCKALMFTGTEAEAKRQANATGKPVYLSLRDPSDEDFGMLNTEKDVELGDDNWTYFYNTTQKTAKEGINYLIVLPDVWEGAEEDQVKELGEAMYTWASMIARNEKEKFQATHKMKNFELDGGVSVTYSEDFAAEYSNTSSYNWLGTDFTHNYFANPDPDAEGEYGDKERTAAAFAGIYTLIGPTAAKWLSSLLNNKYSKLSSSEVDKREYSTKNGLHMEFKFKGSTLEITINPVLAFGITPKSTESRKQNRKESFTIKFDKASHLDFDVYYSTLADTRDVASMDSKTDVFVEENFLNGVDYVKYFISRDVGSRDLEHEMETPRGFIYRTRGGATVRPWEDERKSIFYHSGSTLDERTKKIENPIIRMDKQSISGVPYDNPARFKLYLTNESEKPEAVGGSNRYFTLYAESKYNPKGARMVVDGMPLSQDGITVTAMPGEITEKTLEVWAGEEFDYDNLRLGLISQNDKKVFSEVSFSVHYLLQAGEVEISNPGDKWIMNTDAPYDSIQGWYLPIIISGFNKTQRNFDHIEFLYKESTRGDDYWTNLCGFYADSTIYKAASGTKEMIPENGYIQTRFFGDGTVMEKAYDLKARLFCRNGNSFVTSDSKILAGIKDTRRPQLFGAVDPKDGILKAGENIIFNFSENIEHNYLQAENFEVMGETNETAVEEEPSLLFGGTGYAQSEARRNFADKNMTVEVLIKPNDTGKDMPIFSHGTDGKQLQLWVTKDKKLKAVVDDRTLVSEGTINTDGYRQVALVVNNEEKTVTIFSDDFQCTMDSVTYSGNGPIIFGSTNQTDVSRRDHYTGRMMQGRIWNRAMDRVLLTSYGYKMLTGYEMGLTDYYPMNEGKGEYAIDQALGAHLALDGVAWALPRGMSLRLDRNEQKDVKGMRLKSQFFSRTAEQDYTLMFWFKTNQQGRGALLSNGSGRTTDTEARNKFYIGFEAEKLVYRTNGAEYQLGNDFSDDAWHHYAMTVNRSFQVANIYVDNNLKASFALDSLGGMTGNDFYLGNMVWHEAGDKSDVLHQDKPLSGNIDGICLFQQALPPTLIQRYSQKSVGGSEMGLLTFLGFNRQERQLNNSFTLQPYALNQKILYDQNGKATDVHDSVFYAPVEYVMNHIDRNVGAPMQAYMELRNLNYSYVGRDHQLLINIDEMDKHVNKRQVFVTLYDIPDMNGNRIASPITAEAFIDHNALRWGQRNFKTTMNYNEEEDFTFDMKIVNNSGAPHTYTVENMPKWLSTEILSDIIDPQAEQILTFSINKDTNVGSYDHIIYLTDENGLAEPLALNITVEGKEPEWVVSSDEKQFSMNIVARVYNGDDIVNDSHDIVGVFTPNGTCLGVGHVNYDAVSAETMLYMTIFKGDNQSTALNFKLWDYSTGKTLVLHPETAVKFTANSTLGSTRDPFELRATGEYVQQIVFSKGWNWFSLNVYSNSFRDGISNLLGNYKWDEGDIFVAPSNNTMLSYKNDSWTANDADALTKTMLSVSTSYRFHTNKEKTIEVSGSCMEQKGIRTMRVKKGWNQIGYTPMVNLPVSTALADYLEEATDGDVVKSLTEFAMFTEGANGTRQWKGNLQYMKPGQGYMLYRQKDSDASFVYPFFEPTSTFFAQSSTSPMIVSAAPYAGTMTLTAMAEGIEVMPGDKLLAIAEAEVRGEAALTDSVCYLSISGEEQTSISFAIERDGHIIATSGNAMTYRNHGISGTPNQPTRINFTPAEISAEGWYTLQGYKLQKRPSKSGVYIFNGQKVVIR